MVLKDVPPETQVDQDQQPLFAWWQWDLELNWYAWWQ